MWLTYKIEVGTSESVNTLLVEASNLACSTKQVVIVRDDDTLSSLQELLGNNRMVYTILETKGMEYDDVFVYNFFHSSPCSRAMYTLQELLPDNVNETYAENNMVCRS